MTTTAIPHDAATTTADAAPPRDGGPRRLLAIENLNVSFASGRGRSATETHVVKDVTLSLDAGQCLAIVGESGSGKSVTARTLVGLPGTGARVSATRLEVAGRDALNRSERSWRGIRGREIGFILQDALVSLDPLRPVGREIDESLRLHGTTGAADRKARVIDLLASVGVPEPELRALQRPDQLSGGLRQRALIASAIALDPALVIADEPTTALDVTVQAQVLELLAGMKERGTGIVLISHDLSVVGRMADHVAVMQGGAIVEQGPADRILGDPQHEYTRALLDAVPSAHTRGVPLTRAGRDSLGTDRDRVRLERPADGPAVLRAEHLVKSYKGPDGAATTVVNDVSFELRAGETLGIVGESGSGKSTTAKIALAMLEPDAGRVLLDGAPWTELTTKQRRPRRRTVTSVYQDPLSSFDPRWNAERILLDALDSASPTTAAARRQRIVELATAVGLAEEHLAKHPLQLSGGQRQRLAIARALAPEPEVIVLDEAVSALDVSVQAQVLDLLTDLQQRFGLSYLFISHDLGVIHHMSDRVLVMKDGHAVEQGDADEVFTHPQHPYTRELLASVPTLERAGASG